MAFKMIKLPYDFGALKPSMSKETLEFHYGKHYRKYVSTLNKLTEGTHFETLSLEDVILESFQNDEEVFHNAGQAWNHAFFWNCLTPHKSSPTSVVTECLNDQFGSVQEFKTKFLEAGKTLFGSGWVWLVKKSDGDLSIECTHDAGNPLTQGQIPLLVCDVWEHAYYLDYQNERPKYLTEFWKIINWEFVEKNLNADTRYGENRIKMPLPEAVTYSS